MKDYMKILNEGTKLSTKEDLKLSEYILVSKLGQGQIGKVYQVRHRNNFQKKYALKCI